MLIHNVYVKKSTNNQDAFFNPIQYKNYVINVLLFSFNFILFFCYCSASFTSQTYYTHINALMREQNCGMTRVKSRGRVGSDADFSLLKRF